MVLILYCGDLDCRGFQLCVGKTVEEGRCWENAFTGLYMNNGVGGGEARCCGFLAHVGAGALGGC